MDFTINHFGDIQHHAASVRDWRQTYSQLSRGALESVLLQVSGPRFQLFREHINQRVVQHGEAPRGRICFALPLAVPGSAWVQGREADATCMFVLQGGAEFMFHMPMGMDMLSVTFDRELFEKSIASTSRPDELTSLLRQPVVRVPAARLGAARSRLMELFECTLASARNGVGEQSEHLLEQALLDEIVGLLTDPECDLQQRHRSSSGSYIVEKCHRLTMEDKLNPPSVDALCKRLRVSRRSVQNGFRSITETTPINYIRCVRLNGVRRELTNTRAEELTIGDAAARWGFFHLSHLAADYQQLFGELPSQTCRVAKARATATA
jgi:AraC family transcriptional regulator, ethanolamine operon transcriptional activator